MRPRLHQADEPRAKRDNTQWGRSVAGHFGAQLLQCQRHGATTPRFHWIDTAEPADNELRRFEKQAGEQRIVVPPHFPLDFPGTASIAVHVDSPFWVATRLAPSAGLVVVEASRRAMRIQGTKTIASKQPRQHAPRRRTPQARSKSAAIQTGSAAQEAAVALGGASEGIELSKNPTLSPQHQASQFEPISEGADLATANAPSADRPLASTKRALLI